MDCWLEFRSIMCWRYCTLDIRTSWNISINIRWRLKELPTVSNCLARDQSRDTPLCHFSSRPARKALRISKTKENKLSSQASKALMKVMIQSYSDYYCTILPPGGSTVTRIVEQQQLQGRPAVFYFARESSRAIDCGLNKYQSRIVVLLRWLVILSITVI